MKSFLLSFFSILFLLPGRSFSQDTQPFQKSFTAKWSPAALYFGKVSFGGEYNYRGKHSFTLGVGIPFYNTVVQEIDGERESITQKTFSVLAGYRFYLGKRESAGFYLEPYLKYLEHDANSVIDREIGGTMREFAFTSDYSGFGIGAQLGIQFLIAERLAIDLYFLGPEANASRHNTFSQELGIGLPWNAGDAADAERELREFFQDIPFLRDEIDINVNAQQRTVSTQFKGFLPGIRAGVGIGYRF